MKITLAEAYKILELEEGASEDEAKRAYRKMISKWHPDRFFNKPENQKKLATEKSARINAAYERVLKGSSYSSRRRTSQSEKTSNSTTSRESTGHQSGSREGAGQNRDTHKQGSDGSQQGQGSSRQGQGSSKQRQSDPSNTYREQQRRYQQRPQEEDFFFSKAVLGNLRPWYILLVSTLLILLPAMVIFKNYYVLQDEEIVTKEAPTNPRSDFQRKKVVIEKESAADIVLSVAESISDLASLPREGKNLYDSKEESNKDVANNLVEIVGSPTFFTIGSSQAIVLHLQGEPSYGSSNLLVFGTSMVSFRNGLVTGWNEGQRKLKVGWKFGSNSEKTRFFGVGSKMSEVIAVQGIPRMASQEAFSYGSSTVFFESGKVSRWDQGDTMLGAVSGSVDAVLKRGYFTVGSSQDEVIALQGKPDSHSEGIFKYGGSAVYFQDGVVVYWGQVDVKLLTKLIPKGNIDDLGFFTINSTRNEVLAVQGSPDSLFKSEFFYGNSEVTFFEDRVVAWNQKDVKLKIGYISDSQNETNKYFTVGSTVEEVLRVQGAPQNLSTSEMKYGSSIVYLNNGYVVNWELGNFPLKASLISLEALNTRDFFTVGSTVFEVLESQGNPDSFSDTHFMYGTSIVRFSNSKVVSWQEGSQPLKGQMEYTKKNSNASFFSIGSSIAEVISCQGTPEKLQDNCFLYGTSMVKFVDGVVVAWRTGTVKLAAYYDSRSEIVLGDKFTVGSLVSDVIRVQGNPDSNRKGSLKYGNSKVYTDGVKVVGWKQGNVLLKVIMLPKTRVDCLKTFGVGSTKDEVVSVQGTPEAIEGDRFFYGKSQVEFRDGLVMTVRNSGNNLFFLEEKMQR